MGRVETIRVAFVASFFLADAAFAILLPFKALDGSLEAAGIVFVLFCSVILATGRLHGP